jgi:TRAP-type C4-dicarboxylate transport system permease small subunit
MENATLKSLRIFSTLLNIINRLFETSAMICIVGISLLIFTQIVLRNLFLIGLPWLDEMARFLHISLVFLTVPILFREDAHIQIDLLGTRLSPLWKGVLKLLILLSCVLFAVVFLYSDIDFMKSYWNVPSPAMNMPNIIFFGSAILGMAAFLFNGIEKIIQHIITICKSGPNPWVE